MTIPCRGCLIFPICKQRVYTFIYNLQQIYDEKFLTYYLPMERQVFLSFVPECKILEEYIHGNTNYHQRRHEVAEYFNLHSIWFNLYGTLKG
jgi:hypothetical protein